jgi:16S rRNA (guanine527-N7)-methyltransferase
MDNLSEMHEVAGEDADYAAFERGLTRLGLSISDRQQAMLARYAGLLREWSGRFNLMGPAALQSLWSRHLLDALTLVLALPGGVEAALETPYRVLDVGTGAGLPGIPLQIVFPRWQVTLLESTAKKVRFLKAAVEELALARLDVLGGRAEDLAHDPGQREAYDICVARAVTQTAALVEITLPFVSTGGSAILYRGLAMLSEELHDAEPARVVLGAAPPVVTPVGVGTAEATCLVRYAKLARTPRELPRRPGIPETSPLTVHDAARISAAVAQARGQVRRRGRHR